MNQINKTNQITRQTGLVPDVQTGKIPVCSESFSQPVPPPVRPQRPHLLNQFLRKLSGIPILLKAPQFLIRVRCLVRMGGKPFDRTLV
jgi:hypothetical protein